MNKPTLHQKDESGRNNSYELYLNSKPKATEATPPLFDVDVTYTNGHQSIIKGLSELDLERLGWLTISNCEIKRQP